MPFLSSIRGLLARGLGRNRQPEPRQHRVLCANPHGLHHVAYTEWGDPENPRVLVCVHGLTRNGRDFDFLAKALAKDYRVVCPDVAGRGRSDWLSEPMDYNFPVYINDMVTLIARLDVEQVDWVGTSMGGLIGMFIACNTGSPIRRLVLNDVGPSITYESLRRIGKYVGQAPVFPSEQAVEDYLREINGGFGPLEDAQWAHLAKYSMKPAGGGYTMIYDPAIGDLFKMTPLVANVDLWAQYDRVTCPTLVLRGAESDLLTRATAEEMERRGPRARLVEVPGVGHAPALMDEALVCRVADFLLDVGDVPAA